MGHSKGGLSRPILRRRRPGDVDHEIIDLLFGFMDSFKDRFVAVIGAHGLTLPQGHLIMTLDEPVAMRDVAEGMGYDASHITALVDQLEARQLVERRPDPTDRRVKRIVVTPKGDALRDRIEDELLATILPLDRLTAEQRLELRDLLALVSTPSTDAGRGFGGDASVGCAAPIA
jgi:DNA-binding MarR family transcriptional regulator